MGFKRKKGDGDGEEMESEVRGRPSFNTAERRNVILPSMIKNKDKRAKVYAKQKHEKKVEKQKKIKARDAAEKQALELGEEVNELEILIMLFDFGNLNVVVSCFRLQPPQKMVPKTIENTREADETVCRPDDEEVKFSTFCVFGVFFMFFVSFNPQF